MLRLIRFFATVLLLGSLFWSSSFASEADQGKWGRVYSSDESGMGFAYRMNPDESIELYSCVGARGKCELIAKYENRLRLLQTHLYFTKEATVTNTLTALEVALTGALCAVSFGVTCGVSLLKTFFQEVGNVAAEKNANPVHNINAARILYIVNEQLRGKFPSVYQVNEGQEGELSNVMRDTKKRLALRASGEDKKFYQKFNPLQDFNIFRGTIRSLVQNGKGFIDDPDEEDPDAMVYLNSGQLLDDLSGDALSEESGSLKEERDPELQEFTAAVRKYIKDVNEQVNAMTPEEKQSMVDEFMQKVDILEQKMLKASQSFPQYIIDAEKTVVVEADGTKSSVQHENWQIKKLPQFNIRQQHHVPDQYVDVE